jgi:hypothetical protein
MGVAWVFHLLEDWHDYFRDFHSWQPWIIFYSAIALIIRELLYFRKK